MGEVALADAGGAEQDDVGLGGDEFEVEEVEDALLLYLLGECPVKIVDGFVDGDAGALDLCLDAALESCSGFFVDDVFEELEVAEPFASGLGCGLLVDLGDAAEFEVFEVLLKGGRPDSGPRLISGLGGSGLGCLSLSIHGFCPGKVSRKG